MKVLGLIPARSGSKGIPHKNIATFCGKPLMAHSIEQALRSKSITRVIVSTDSDLYASIARQYGAEVPFLRPPEISGDLSTDLEVFQHAIQWLSEQEDYHPDICVHLRPTYPTRRSEDIDQAVELLRSNPSCDSVRTVVTAPETPWKMWFINEEGLLEPVIKSDLPEPYNQPRQALRQAYLQNACIDVVWTRVILQMKSMTGRRIVGMVMPHSHDIDHPSQFRAAALVSETPVGKRFVFDLDGVIATLTPDNDYGQAEPIRSTIDLVNRLYDAGNTIVLFTARGTATGKDWKEVTRKQLRDWGVKFHELIFGKPHADYYVDDRHIDIDALQELTVRKKT